MQIVLAHSMKARAHGRIAFTVAAAVGLEAAKVLHPTYGPCQAVAITAEDADLRRTFDGTTPTTGVDGVGAIIEAGDALYLMGGANVQNLLVIGVSSSGVIQVDYLYE